MTWGLPAILLFFIIIVLYLIRPSWVLLLWLITTPLIAPFMVLFSGISDFKDQQVYVWAIWGIYNRAYLLIILLELFKKSKLPQNLKMIIVPGIILSGYLLIHNLVTHPDILGYFGQVLGLIYTVPPMIVLMMNKKAWPSMKGIYITLIAVYIIELIWLPLNSMGIYAYPAKYQEMYTMPGELLFASGSFTRSNMLADYVSITYFFIMIDFFTRKSLSRIKFSIISIMAVVLLLSAGSKLPILVVVLGFMMCVLLFRKDKTGVVFITLLAFAGLFYFLSTNTKEINSNNEGVNRIVEGMSTFVQAQKNKDDDNSTFSISNELLDRYFWNSPLIGNGYSYKGDDDAYPINKSGIDLNSLKADATFAYHLVEYGIIGTIFFMFFYYSVIKYTGAVLLYNRRKIVLAVFVFLLLFSATEGGLFNRSLYTYIYIFFFAFARCYKE